MSEAEVRLSECWQNGVRLLHAWKKAGEAKHKARSEQYMAQAEEWATGALEAAKPWPILRARLEPLGELKGREQLIIHGWIVCEDHAMALRCLAVRLHRIDAVLESFATVPAKQRKPPGRKPGQGAYDDTAMLKDIHSLVTGEDITAWAAAGKVADAESENWPYTTPGQLRKRIYDKYRKEYVSK